jgi:hypothetical protein
MDGRVVKKTGRRGRGRKKKNITKEIGIGQN